GAVETCGAAEPVVERDRRIGCADHQCDHAAADRRNHHIAPQAAAFGRALDRLGGHVVRYGRLVIHVSYIGRTRTAGPLTIVTAKNSTTSTPSAKAMAMER